METQPITAPVPKPVAAVPALSTTAAPPPAATAAAIQQEKGKKRNRNSGHKAVLEHGRTFQRFKRGQGLTIEMETGEVLGCDLGEAFQDSEKWGVSVCETSSQGIKLERGRHASRAGSIIDMMTLGPIVGWYRMMSIDSAYSFP